jgi:hypothetical protein
MEQWWALIFLLLWLINALMSQMQYLAGIFLTGVYILSGHNVMVH